MKDTTLAVLTFGEHTRLFTRCIESIIKYTDFKSVAELRIGLNAVSSDTLQYMTTVRHRLADQTKLLIYYTTDNTGKYRVMREMFYGHARPLHTPYVCWFDDDSFVTQENWLPSAVDKVKETNAAVLGSVYRISARPGQRRRIVYQPWYRQKEIAENHQFKFATGGWWVADTAFLATHNWPFPQIEHNGGDSILGELCRQQDRLIVNHKQGVAINADDAGNESKAPRRGISSPWPFESVSSYVDGPSRSYTVLEELAYGKEEAR